MPSVFPELLFLGLLGPLIIRVFVGVVLLWWGHRRLLRRIRDAGAMVPPVHPTSLKTTLGLVEILVGLALIVGFYTQVAAIAGGVLATLYFFIARRGIPTPGGRIAYAALLVMSLSLIVTGAGAFAFDLPL